VKKAAIRNSPINFTETLSILSLLPSLVAASKSSPMVLGINVIAATERRRDTNSKNTIIFSFIEYLRSFLYSFQLNLDFFFLSYFSSYVSSLTGFF
jgi:hypothetical protein